MHIGILMFNTCFLVILIAFLEIHTITFHYNL